MMQVVLTCIVSLAVAQDYPRDTSYTIGSAFLKAKKKFPDVKVAVEDTNGVRIARNQVYSKTSTRPLHADMFFPEVIPQGQRLPVVVMVHGGGWISGNKSLMETMALRLAKSGYVAMAVEYRLSPEAGYPAGVNDIIASIDWLKTNAGLYNIDADNVVLMGCSAGGQLATLVGLIYGKNVFGSGKTGDKKRIRAVINMDGVLAFHHPESAEGRVAGLWLGGDYATASDNWEQASPLTHVGKDSPPILFINSQYPRFHAGRDDMLRVYDRFKIPYEIYTIDNSPHTFWLFHPYYDATMGYVLAFLKTICV